MILLQPPVWPTKWGVGLDHQHSGDFTAPDISVVMITNTDSVQPTHTVHNRVTVRISFPRATSELNSHSIPSKRKQAERRYIHLHCDLGDFV
jgi:hypothetical protein